MADSILFPARRSAWARYIQRDGRVFLCIDDTTIYNHRVLVKGEATVLEEPNLGGQWVEIARRMSVRYLGEHGPQYLSPHSPNRDGYCLSARVKMTTWQGVDWAERYKHSKW